MKKWIFILLLGLFASLSCKKGPQGPTIYAAGFETNTDGNLVAKLWKNGRAMPLALTAGNTRSYSSSVYAAGGSVYVVGYEEVNGQELARVWKNGVQMQPDLNTGTTYAETTDVFALQTASGTDVYIAGRLIVNGKFKAAVWKNGELMQPALASSVGSTSVTVNAVHVLETATGTEVYATGYENDANGKAIARVWKNGQLMPDLSLNLGSTGSYAESVYAVETSSGTDVFVTGYELLANGNTIARIWKNGQVQPLSITNGITYSVASSVYVSDGVVYVAGNEEDANGKDIAVVWKNGQLMPDLISNGGSSAYSLYVLDGMVYVAGREGLGKPAVWKDDQPMYLPVSNPKYLACANAVCVVR
jgi:hypothetical protein